MTAIFPPTLEVERVTALSLTSVALPEFPEVFKVNTPVKLLDVLSRVITWLATSVVKLDAPDIVKVPISVIFPPEVTLKFPFADTFTPKSTPPVPASRVKSLNEDAVDAKFTAFPLAVAINVSGLDVEVTPSTVIVPLVAPPMMRLPEVIKARSEFVREKLPAVLPSPIVPLSETFRVVVAVPEVILPVELKDILLEVIVNALLLVVRVLPLEIEKLPAPSPSESEMRLVVPFVVRFEESVMPFSALTTKPWKLESAVPKVTEEFEAVAFKLSIPNWSLLLDATPETTIFPFVPPPIVRLPAVIFPSSVLDKVMLLVVPNPIVAPDKELKIVVPAVPLFRVPLKSKSPAVMERALLPVVNALLAAMVKVPDPSLSVSASKVMVPFDVKLSLMLMSPVAFRFTAPAPDIPPVVAFRVIEPADAVSDAPDTKEILSSESVELLESPSRDKLPAVDRLLLLMASPFAADKVKAPCPVIVPPLCPIFSFPEWLKLLPAKKVMFPFTRLRSPVPTSFPCSVVVIFIPKPELNPSPKEPPSETLIVVEPVPLSRVPDKTRSLAVTVSALLVVDKEPVDTVKSPEPLLSVSA